MDIRATLLTVALSVLMMGCASQTSDVDKMTIEEVKEFFCQSMSGAAKTIMKGRLNDVTIERMLDVFAKESEGIEFKQILKDREKTMIVEAYRRPNFTSDEQKERAIREFGSEEYIKCVEEDFAVKFIRAK